MSMFYSNIFNNKKKQLLRIDNGKDLMWESVLLEISTFIYLT